MGKENAGAPFISLKEFANRIGCCINTARKMYYQKEFCDLHISINANPCGDRARPLINWDKYMEYVEGCSVIPETGESSRAICCSIYDY